MVAVGSLGEVIATDVLVIGGGISGLVAAIKAKEKPVDVLIVDKATIGWSGQLPVSGGSMSVIPAESDPDVWAEWAVKVGGYLNDQEWTLSLFRELYDSMREFAGWGVPVARDEKGKMKLRIIPQRYKEIPRLRFDRGKMNIALRARARAKGVKMLNKVEVVDLLKEDDRVVGAVGFNMIDGRFYIFRAKATILASGGCDFKVNRLFAIGSTGEGLAMPYRAGAEFRNCEFGNLYGAVPKDYDAFYRALPGSFLFNAQGESLAERYVPPEKGTLVTSALAVAKEVMAGRGPVYMDLGKARKEDLEGFDYEAERRYYAGMFYTYHKVGIDPFKQKLEATVTFYGKLTTTRVDLECKTTVPGLWAIGDASYLGSGWAGTIAGGEYGGWALAYCIVSAMKAGRAVPDYVSRVSLGGLRAEEVGRLKKEAFAPLKRKKGILPGDLVYAIQEVVFPVKYNFFRSRERLEEGLDKIEEQREKLGRLWAKDPHELVKCHEAKSIALCAEMMFRSALMREETRGWHLREDFPQRDDKNWLKWVIVKKPMKLYTEPVPIEKYKFKP